MGSLTPLSSENNPEIMVQQNSPFATTLILNRPRQRNSLSPGMLSRLSNLFLALEDDPKLNLVILKANGKAFCSGGDILEIARQLYNDSWRFAVETNTETYKLLYSMATCSKPQVSILDGVCMGRGVAIAMSGGFRIATENSMFQVPEVALGGFPDTSASYFLSRLSGFFGEYVALTCTQLNGAEMVACGLATHFVPSSKLALLEEALVSKASEDLTFSIRDILNEYSIQPKVKDKESAIYKMGVIDTCFSKGSVEEILGALEKINLESPNVWLSSTIGSLCKASPTSLKITLRSIREGRCQGLGECLAREYGIAYHIMRGKISPDFRNGCSATFLKKGMILKWEPCRLELVSDQMVDKYFAKLDDDDELKLPARSSIHMPAIAKL